MNQESSALQIKIRKLKWTGHTQKVASSTEIILSETLKGPESVVFQEFS